MPHLQCSSKCVLLLSQHTFAVLIAMPPRSFLAHRCHPSGGAATEYRTFQKCGSFSDLVLLEHCRQHGKRYRLPQWPAGETYPSFGREESLRGSSLVHNQIVVDVVNIQRAFDGIGGAKNHWVLPIELSGPASEIPHLKNLASILPRTGCTQFRAEQ